MGVGLSSSLSTTADRSPLHDVRQPAPRDRRSTRYKFKFMDELCCWLAEPKLAAPARFRPSGSSAAAFSRFASEGWWSQTGSNRRPPACKAGALPTELWPRLRNAARLKVVGLGRLELPTSRLSSARSNQLSYKPNDRPRPFSPGISRRMRAVRARP